VVFSCVVLHVFFNLFIQDERLRSMDRFFDCVATLMSNNLRCLVESSLDDLASIFEVYKNGNEFHGEFERRLPVMPQPIIINVVSRIILHFALLFVLLNHRRISKSTGRDRTFIS
jgi:hypothetical protein